MHYKITFFVSRYPLIALPTYGVGCMVQKLNAGLFIESKAFMIKVQSVMVQKHMYMKDKG